MTFEFLNCSFLDSLVFAKILGCQIVGGFRYCSRIMAASSHLKDLYWTRDASDGSQLTKHFIQRYVADIRKLESSRTNLLTLSNFIFKSGQGLI